MPAPRKYSDELRERAVRMVEQTLREDPRLAHKRACSQVGDQLWIPAVPFGPAYSGGRRNESCEMRMSLITGGSGCRASTVISAGSRSNSLCGSTRRAGD